MGGLRLLSFHAIEIACEAAVVAVTVFLLYIPMPFQIGNRALDCAFGKTEVGGDGLYAGPAFALRGRHTLEVHIDRLGAVRQAVIRIDGIKIADGVTSYVLM